jgi:Family of unknown function (DUF6069)
MSRPVREHRSTTDLTDLWGGGIATAALAAVVAFVGVVVARAIFDVPVLAPRHEGTLGGSPTGLYVVFAGTGAIVCTVLLGVLGLITERAVLVYWVVVGLATVVLSVVPLLAADDVGSRVATALIDLAVGLTYLIVLPLTVWDTLARERG